ncbi:MAG: 1-deoxy-D-xylulose-5-phosphate reductoisomerase [Candidatus Omnitrophota bacterium]|jgi:1-deoxy-D-xylulose-5-phosphate reductoisomerase
MKRIALLGSTGSIGQNALAVIRQHPQRFRAVALSAHANIELLRCQIKEFSPEIICVTDEAAGVALNAQIGRKPRLLIGTAGLTEICKDKRVDAVVMAVSGSEALLPILSALDNHKKIALANKEALVMAGPLIMRRARKNNAAIIPIDSEQSAIWQCLEGQERRALRRILLTASGGPFRDFTGKQLKNISVSQALSHPRWKMGKKISVDSATLMNKGLEVLEAMSLFGLKAEEVEVVVHPESIIHSMVEFIDGVVMAQLSVTDMRIPIQYALSYPERLKTSLRGLDFVKIKSLNFTAPDVKKFACLALAYQAAREGGICPCALNAANEVCVEEFLKGNLTFTGIPGVIEKVLSRHRAVADPSLNDIMHVDSWARVEARKVIQR